MTVSYAYEVASSSFGCFLKLFSRWRASIYKLIWRDLIVLLCVYFSISLIYQFALSENHQRNFEGMVEYCKISATLIPLTFVLGFYVSIIVKRWWDQYFCLPWPDAIAVYVSTLIHGHDDRGRVMRRTIMRYVCACSTMVFTMIAPAVKKRFPTLNDLIDCGLLVENEKQIIDDMDEKFPKHPKNWMPIVWASSIVMRARREGRIRDDFSMTTIIDELNKHRDYCYRLLQYDIISIPLLYTQVVTLTVYSYFLASIFGKQYLLNNEDDMLGIRRYFPLFLVLEFIFYMGWLKVAESLICPFGEDDDDFELNWMIDRNLQMSYLIVDEMHHDHPELVKDQYWDEIFPNELPYPETVSITRAEPPLPSTANIDIGTKNKEKDNLGETDRERASEGTMHLFWRRLESIYYSPSELSGVSQYRNSNRYSTSAHRSEYVDYDIELGQYVDSPLHNIMNNYDNANLTDYTPNVSEDSLISSKINDNSSVPNLNRNEEFDLLRETRKRERLERQRRKLLRTLDTVTAPTLIPLTKNATTTTTPSEAVFSMGIQTLPKQSKKKKKKKI